MKVNYFNKKFKKIVNFNLDDFDVMSEWLKKIELLKLKDMLNEDQKISVLEDLKKLSETAINKVFSLIIMKFKMNYNYLI